MPAPIVYVGYTAAEMSAVVSCDVIANGRVRGLLRRAGRLYALTGAIYSPYNGPRVFDACEAVPLDQHPGQSWTYAERSAALYVAADIDSPEEAEHLEEGRFYEGIRVVWRGASYVLQQQRECWLSMATPLKQGALF